MKIAFSSVRARLVILVVSLILFILLNGVAGMLSGARMIGAFATTYNDRMLPLQQLQTISNMYAVKVVDIVDKVRLHQIDWDTGLKNLGEVAKYKEKTWQAYISTSLGPEEKWLADQVQQSMRDGDSALSRLQQIFANKDMWGLEQFSAGELRRKINPITNKLNELSALQLLVAAEEFHKTAIVPACGSTVV